MLDAPLLRFSDPDAVMPTCDDAAGSIVSRGCQPRPAPLSMLAEGNLVWIVLFAHGVVHNFAHDQ